MSTEVVITDDSKERLRVAHFPELDNALRVWVLQCDSRRVPISGPTNSGEGQIDCQQAERKFRQKINRASQ